MKVGDTKHPPQADAGIARHESVLDPSQANIMNYALSLKKATYRQANNNNFRTDLVSCIQHGKDQREFHDSVSSFPGQLEKLGNMAICLIWCLAYLKCTSISVVSRWLARCMDSCHCIVRPSMLLLPPDFLKHRRNALTVVGALMASGRKC